ncbi:hypothetical protein ACLB2K_036077 [Fragaria x ananassa]
MSVEEAAASSLWTWDQDKAFENALATYPEDSPDRWEKIAADVEGKSVEEIKHHYELLVDDISQIEAGCIPLPCYNSSFEGSTSLANDEGTSKKGHYASESNHGSKASRADQERRKGIAWTEDEHRQFLLGLEKYGKGDWRSISRNFVVTRTPTQVASHAQKYFIRLNSMNKDRRRSSIHDITSVDNGEVATIQGPITGQSNGPAVGSSGSGKLAKQSAAGPPGVGMYGAPSIGQPIGGPLVSAVGTPVNLAGPSPHMAYGVRAPMPPGALVPGAPMNMPPMTYPMPHTAHR